MCLIINIFLITGVESVHSALRKSDETHNCHITQELGSDVHVKKSKNSLCYWNAKIFPHLTDSINSTDNAPSDVSPVNLNVSADFSTTVTAPDVQEDTISDTRNDMPDGEAALPPHEVLVHPADLLSDPPEVPDPPSKVSESISLSEHLHQNGLEIREDILRTETGNCW